MKFELIEEVGILDRYYRLKDKEEVYNTLERYGYRDIRIKDKKYRDCVISARRDIYGINIVFDIHTRMDVGIYISLPKDMKVVNGIYILNERRLFCILEFITKAVSIFILGENVRSEDGKYEVCLSDRIMDIEDIKGIWHIIEDINNKVDKKWWKFVKYPLSSEFEFICYDLGTVESKIRYYSGIEEIIESLIELIMELYRIRNVVRNKMDI